MWKDSFCIALGDSVADIKNYFEYIIWKQKTVNDKPLIWTCVKKIENIITFKIKTEYYIELLTPLTMKLFESTENKITKDKSA